jgi:hypothetical protein
MERLKEISANRLRRAPLGFSRFLIDEINWDERLIGISGARGTGKTTLLLQYMKTRIPADSNSLYVSLDDIYFSETPLIYFAEEFSKKGGDYLFLDEVHKYPNWSQELKNIYDNLPDLKVVFTSSSALDIFKGSHDLSRRAMVYNLPGLSFREFIGLKYEIQFQSFTLSQILEGNNAVVSKVLDGIKPLKLFEEYLQYGYYPFFMEAGENYNFRLINIVNQVLENDLPTIFHIDFYSVMKIKKMLSVLSRIVPYKPNIQQLVSQSGTSRDSLLKFLFYLEKAEILKWLTKDTFGINYLNKPDKLFLNNTNLMFALANDKPNIGNVRETFFLNQLIAKHQVSYPEKGDFLVDEKYLFEIGGQKKNAKQLGGQKNAFIAADGIEYAFENKIPLWLFGFLY